MPTPTVTSTLQQQTLQLASQYGGSFFASLAAAGLQADPLNRNRLFEAFPELERRYGPTSPFWTAQPQQAAGLEVSHG